MEEAGFVALEKLDMIGIAGFSLPGAAVRRRVDVAFGLGNGSGNHGEMRVGERRGEVHLGVVAW